jgi:predicted SAM-dependent methyltransferase
MSSTRPRTLPRLFAQVAITALAVALFFTLRSDVAAQARGVANRYIFPDRVIQQYMKTHSVRKLQLGAGTVNLEGWLNSDIEPSDGQAYIDAAGKYPLPDESFRYVYSEHLIEHLDYEQGLKMLEESHRILQPGGKIRIHTPDLHKFISLFDENKPETSVNFMNEKVRLFGFPRTPDTETYLLNAEMHKWGHQFLYTRKLLQARLAQAGFTHINQVALRESSDPAFHRISGRIENALSETDSWETMAIEAVRR